MYRAEERRGCEHTFGVCEEGESNGERVRPSVFELEFHELDEFWQNKLKFFVMASI